MDCPPAKEGKFSYDPPPDLPKIMTNHPPLPVEGTLSLLVTSHNEHPVLVNQLSSFEIS